MPCAGLRPELAASCFGGEAPAAGRAAECGGKLSGRRGPRRTRVVPTPSCMLKPIVNKPKRLIGVALSFSLAVTAGAAISLYEMRVDAFEAGGRRRRT